MKVGARLALLIVVLGTIGCDRVTKHVASESLAGRPTQSFLRDTVRLTYAENVGGFLSLGEELAPAARTAVFTVGTGIILAAAVWLAFRRRWTLWQSVAFALFIGGGASNWIDRLLHGRVVDFLNVGVGSLRTGIFNVADVAILAAAVLLLVSELWPRAMPGTNGGRAGQ
jgi:signal peptidase II